MAGSIDGVSAADPPRSAVKQGIPLGQRKRTLVEHPTYFFVTAATLSHAPLLKDDGAMVIAKERLLGTAVEMGVKILAFVIMSTHIHFVGFFSGGGAQLSKYMLSLKGRIRKDTLGDARMWETRFDDKLIRTEKMLAEDINYIHHNPVKAGLVLNPENYEFSSAAVWAGIRKDERILTRFEID